MHACRLNIDQTAVIKYGSGIDGLSKGECNNKAIKEQFYGT